MSYTVKAVAKVAGVSVRTLHHYDQIGLLRPGAHSAAGYRLYGEKDLERLQQVLFFKELGFELKEIRQVLADPDFDRERALKEHRKLLLERQERVGRLIASVDRTLKAMKRGKPMNATMFEGFDHTQYEEEARQRWGGSPAWAESQKRWKSYTKKDLEQLQKEGTEVMEHLTALAERDPADADVQKWIGEHHAQINKWFYTCPPEVYRAIGDGYVEDPRFTAFYEKFRPGMAKFMRAAMHVYCDRVESKK